MAAEILYFPFDDGPGEDSREDRWGAMMRYMRTTGIISESLILSTTGDNAVAPQLNMQIQVYDGEAWLQGFMFQHNDDTFPIVINDNTSGDDRIDLVTIRLDTDANTILYHVEEGTPSAVPIVPTPVQDDVTWDLPLAEVYVADGAIVINLADITDVRVRSIQGDPGGITLANAGTTSLVNDGVGPNLATKGLVAGTNMTFGTSATDVTINADTVTLTSAGGTETLVNDGTGPALATKGLTAGSNITLTGAATAVTISSPTPACRVINTAPSALGASTSSNITFNSEIYDPTGMHSTSINTNRVNIATTGLYYVSYCMQIVSAGAPTGAIYTTIFRDTAGVALGIVADGILATSAAAITLIINLSTIAFCTAGDFLYVSCNNSTNVTQTPAYVNEYSPCFSVAYMGTN